MNDAINRENAIGAISSVEHIAELSDGDAAIRVSAVNYVLKNLPTAQPEITYCKDCKHWKKTCGDNQWSLGNCGLFEKRLVMCKGYCAWAERRTDESD